MQRIAPLVRFSGLLKVVICRCQNLLFRQNPRDLARTFPSSTEGKNLPHDLCRFRVGLEIVFCSFGFPVPAFCANARIFSRSSDAMRVLNLMSFFISSPIVDKVGLGFCPKLCGRRAAALPQTRQTRCWLLPNGRIFPRCGGDSLRCSWTYPHVGATWAFSAAPHTHSLSGQKAAHSGDTRLTVRCRRSAHPQGRLCRLFSWVENRHYRHV